VTQLRQEIANDSLDAGDEALVPLPMEQGDVDIKARAPEDGLAVCQTFDQQRRLSQVAITINRVFDDLADVARRSLGEEGVDRVRV
jgi:hypothetical protein